MANTQRKGVLLAGGSGTRLWPATKVVTKQLLTVYDKPMIYYPLSTLMLAGIREILLISTPEETPRFENLLGSGADWGLSISYCVQDKPEGIAQAMLLAEDFLDGAPSALVLGDNLFFGNNLQSDLRAASALESGATVFAYAVADPERYGVVGFDVNRRAISLEEKPTRPKSRYAVTGLYFYDGRAPALARTLTPSPRGELEITDLNRIYLEEGALKVSLLGRGHAWLDTGTPDSLLDAGQFIATLERRQGLKIGCCEEVAWRNGWISDNQLAALGHALQKSAYGQYLMALLEQS